LIGLLDSDRKYKLRELREISLPHLEIKQILKFKPKNMTLKSFLVQNFTELNPIDGLKCFQKEYIPKNTDGSFERMVERMNNTRDIFKEKEINLKLWNRFFSKVVTTLLMKKS
jgi:hypothetical protein